MRTPKRNKKPKSAKLCLTAKQVAVLHRVVQEFDENGGASQLDDAQLDALETIVEKVERAKDFCETMNSL